MPEALVVGAVAGVMVALIVLAVRLGRRSDRRDRAAPAAERGRRVVSLDVISRGERTGPVRRLAVAAAAPLFEEDPALEQVEVRDREGVLLAIVDRAEGLELAERDPFGDTATAQRLDLPAAVRDQLPDDPTLVDVVAAILAAAGHEPVVEQDVVRVGDRAVVAAESTDHDSLSGAFLRYRSSGARYGVVVSRRSVPGSEVRRRELLAPDLRYAPPGALQRMADAVTVGGDPIGFALGPPRAR